MAVLLFTSHEVKGEVLYVLGTALFAFDDAVDVYMLLKHDLEAIIDCEPSL